LIIAITKSAFKSLKNAIRKLLSLTILKVISFIVARPKLRHFIQHKLPIPGKINAWIISKWAANSTIIGGGIRKNDNWGQKAYHTNYFEMKVAEQVNSTYNLDIDHAYISELRHAKSAYFNNESPEEIAHTIDCIFLALLTRHPSQSDIARHIKIVQKEKKYHSVFALIMNSSEYKQKGYRRVR
jgi:hypothetical protein